MKIALNLKKEHKEIIVKELLARNFEISSSSFNDIWVYGLTVINGSEDEITIEQKNYTSYKIKKDDIEYFEIHLERDK